MKPIQVGVLVVVAAVGGGLFVKWQGSRTTVPPPAMAPVPAVAAPPALPSAPPSQAVETKPAQTAPPAAITEEQPRKASDRPRKPHARRAGEAVSIAENRAQENGPAFSIPNDEPKPATATPPAVRVPADEPEAVAAAPPTAPIAPPVTLPPAPASPRSVTLAAGTLIQARTVEALSSERNEAGDTFTATLDQPLVVDGLVIAERGARLEGRVVQAQRAGKVKGVAELAIELTQLNTSDRQRLAIETETFAKHGETSKGEDAAKVGTVAAIGAVIGAIAGGGKGAGIGAAAGGAAGAGGVMGTRGKETEIRPETRISFRLKNSITITERLTARR